MLLPDFLPLDFFELDFLPDDFEPPARFGSFLRFALAIGSGAPLSRDRFFTPDQQAEIAVAYARTGGRNLVGLRDSLGGKYSIDDLRIFRAFAQRL